MVIFKLFNLGNFLCRLVRDGEMSFKEESNSSRSEYTQFKSSTKKIADYIESDIRFKIPAFQRSYSWSGEDVIKLINDAVIRGDKGHFIGAFIVASDENWVIGYR